MRARAVIVVLVAIVALFAACSSPFAVPPHHKAPDGGACDRAYFVSPEFSPAEHARLDSAIDRWNERATLKFCLFDKTSTNHDDEHGVYRATASEWAGRDATLPAGSYLLGLYSSPADRVGIRENLPLDELEIVALHEFGHAHGLEHTASPAIMAPAIGDVFDFTEIDMAECRRVGACPGALVAAFEDTSGGCLFVHGP